MASDTSDRAVLKVVYVLAGHRRRADIREHLHGLGETLGFTLDMREFDLMRDPKQDLLQTAFWEELKSFILTFQPFRVIATPPCSTYSRARHFYKQSPGPRPIRSRQFPKGFPSKQRPRLVHCWQIEPGNFTDWHAQWVQHSWESFRKIWEQHRQAFQHFCGRRTWQKA